MGKRGSQGRGTSEQAEKRREKEISTHLTVLSEGNTIFTGISLVSILTAGLSLTLASGVVLLGVRRGSRQRKWSRMKSVRRRSDEKEEEGKMDVRLRPPLEQPCISCRCVEGRRRCQHGGSIRGCEMVVKHSRSTVLLGGDVVCHCYEVMRWSNK